MTATRVELYAVIDSLSSAELLHLAEVALAVGAAPLRGADRPPSRHLVGADPRRLPAQGPAIPSRRPATTTTTKEAGMSDKTKPDSPLGDLSNARRFVTEHGEVVRRVSRFRRWYVWDSRVWAPDDNDSSEVSRLAKATVDGLGLDVLEAPEEDRDPSVPALEAVRLGPWAALPARGSRHREPSQRQHRRPRRRSLRPGGQQRCSGPALRANTTSRSC